MGLFVGGGRVNDPSPEGLLTARPRDDTAYLEKVRIIDELRRSVSSTLHLCVT